MGRRAAIRMIALSGAIGSLVGEMTFLIIHGHSFGVGPIAAAVWGFVYLGAREPAQ